MTILFLEDKGAVTEYVTEALKRLGHVVIEAYDVNDAQSAWEDRVSQPIDCLLVDLNMPADGLTDEEKGRTAAGLLTGWIWLETYVFPEVPEMRTRTIIFSDYLDDFTALVVPESRYSGVARVPKRAPYSPIERLLLAVEEAGKHISSGRTSR
jgi:DNA-binding NarL/FixJ family response regulator